MHMGKAATGLTPSISMQAHKKVHHSFSPVSLAPWPSLCDLSRSPLPTPFLFRGRTHSCYTLWFWHTDPVAQSGAVRRCRMCWQRLKVGSSRRWKKRRCGDKLCKRRRGEVEGDAGVIHKLPPDQCMKKWWEPTFCASQISFVTHLCIFQWRR